MIDAAPQGTAEWKLARLGHVTASRFADVITEPKKKTDPLSKTAESYLLELVGEHLSGQPADEFENYAMKWGNLYEPEARDAYARRIWHTGRSIKEVGFELHDTEELIGCSVDGLVDDDATIEIKAPLNIGNHVRVLLSGEMPSEHVAQVQGQLWITGRQFCDFVSYHPKCVNDENKLVVVRVARDEDFIAELSEKVIRFRNKLSETLTTIAERTGWLWSRGNGVRVKDVI